MNESDRTIAWTAMAYRSPVLSGDGDEIGTAESLLGDEDADIFHGIVVRRKRDRQLVEVAAAHVRRITQNRVETDLRDADVSELPRYEQQRWFHIEWGGLFRKRPEWDETSGPTR